MHRFAEHECDLQNSYGNLQNSYENLQNSYGNPEYSWTIPVEQEKSMHN